MSTEAISRRQVSPPAAVSEGEIHKLDALWRASNYLSVGQIYLLDNPLLRKPLAREHIKPRLLGHWGTTPGLNFLYVHLNRAIRKHDLDMMYVIGPGHGGPALVAQAYLEGTYSEVYPNISQDEDGMKRLFKQFSFPGGIPSHVAPETPGSIHEGGELGYALSHAYGAAFDNPNLIVACVVGDGEAETGPLATGWHGNKFLNPARDGCVLPILHLNGYKIANPCFLARIPKEELAKLIEGYGYKPYFVEGDEPEAMHQEMAATLEQVVGDIRKIWADARERGIQARPTWPMIVLRTPKGWTCPREIDGKLCEGYWRSHQVPMGDMDKPEHIAILEHWMRSYRPEELFDAKGTLKPELAELAPKGERRMSANPHANGGLLLKDLRLPDFRDYAVEVAQPRRGVSRGDAPAGQVPARRDEAESRPAELPALQSRREQLQSLAGRPRGHEPLLRGRDPAGGRPPRARRPRDGGALGAPVPGLAGGLSAHRPARLLQLLRGLHPHHRLDVQPARQVAEGVQSHPVAAADRLAQLPAELARLAAGSQRLQPPGSGLHRSRGQQEGRGDPRLPAAGREHAAVGHGPVPAQPQLRERHRGRQAARAAVAHHGPGDQALHRGHRDLGLGEQRPGQRAGRRHGLLRRRADARDAGGRPADAPPSSRSSRSAWSTSST